MSNKVVVNAFKYAWAVIKRAAAAVWAYLKVAKMELIVMIGVFALDLIAKSLVENFLAFNEAVPIIPYVFNAHKVHNYSAAFGSSWIRSWIGDIGARIFFCVFAVAASVAFFLVLIKHKGKSKWFRVSLALFIAGAMGNCVDRMALGYVRDFIEFVFFGMTIGGRTTWQYIFNIADVALVSGVIMIVIYFLFMYRDSDKAKNAAEVEGVAEGDTQAAENTENAGAEKISAENANAEETDGNDDVATDETNGADGVTEEADNAAPQELTTDIGGDGGI